MCKSGYSDNTGKPTWFCVDGPKTKTASSDTAGQCEATFTKADNTPGTVAALPLMKCGYNKDANFYCPIQTGDPVYSAVLSALSGASAWSSLNTNCNPASTNCATKLSAAV